MASIMPVFKTFSKEAALIGTLLSGYGELELNLCHCVANGVEDLDMVVKAMFRPRGETQRIDVADAIGRKKYHELKMGALFEEAVDGMRYCLLIRNQFSHCYWYDDNSGQLAFVNLEEIAKKHAVIKDLGALTVKHVTPTLLADQELYFLHISHSLLFLNYEGRKKRNKLRIHAMKAPTTKDRPPKYLP